MKLNKTVTLVVGDWSCDGHEKMESVVIHSNLGGKEIEAAYQKGVEVVGFDLQEFCADYEDSNLPMECAKKLEAHGLDLNSTVDDPEGDGNSIQLFTDAYADIYLFIVKLGDPSFEHKVVDDDSDRLNIGGYGLFY